ncbi:MAG: site-2 protease family protein [Anaerolineales bacterium]|jgi:membrane-associated protease RseP (regulator of RpoE activity)
MTITYTQSIEPAPPPDPYLQLVKKVFQIEEVTWGDEKQNFLVRYRGRLLLESEAAYQQLSKSLQNLEITPLFRIEDGDQIIVLLRGIVRPKPSNPWINLILFLLTGLSVVFAGTFFEYRGPLTSDLNQLLPHLVPTLLRGLAFAASLLAILLAHEFGHYLAARYHRSAVTLPYFIPFPFSPFGTMGAFIQLKEPPKNKRILLDIGIAGPLAGLVVAIPLLLLGLYLSQIDRLPLFLAQGQAISLEGNSILYLLMKYIAFGNWLPAPATFGNVNPLIYWLRYFFTGQPIPYGAVDVMLHPVAWAGWAGLLITALNLIPAGQLDGGHILYALFGKRSRILLPFILVALIILGTVWSGWWLWAFLIFLLGRSHAEPLDQITPLDPRRKALAVLGLVVFVLVFTPIPLSIFS